MQIVSQGDNLHEIPKTVFLDNIMWFIYNRNPPPTLRKKKTKQTKQNKKKQKKKKKKKKKKEKKNISYLAIYSDRPEQTVKTQIWCRSPFKPTSVAKLDARPTGDREVAGSTSAGSEIFFRGDWSWNILYDHCLPSANLRRAVIRVSGERMCTIMVNRSED